MTIQKPIPNELKQMTPEQHFENYRKASAFGSKRYLILLSLIGGSAMGISLLLASNGELEVLQRLFAGNIFDTVSAVKNIKISWQLVTIAIITLAAARFLVLKRRYYQKEGEKMYPYDSQIVREYQWKNAFSFRPKYVISFLGIALLTGIGMVLISQIITAPQRKALEAQQKLEIQQRFEEFERKNLNRFP